MSLGLAVLRQLKELRCPKCGSANLRLTEIEHATRFIEYGKGKSGRFLLKPMRDSGWAALAADAGMRVECQDCGDYWEDDAADEFYTYLAAKQVGKERAAG